MASSSSEGLLCNCICEQEEVVVVGRIVLDADSAATTSVKGNEISLQLESSRLMGSGLRVPLRFESDIKIRGAPRGQLGFGIYPGAIVALKGKNGGGGWFSVTEFLSVCNLLSCAVYPFLKLSAPCTPSTQTRDIGADENRTQQWFIFDDHCCWSLYSG